MLSDTATDPWQAGPGGAGQEGQQTDQPSTLCNRYYGKAGPTDKILQACELHSAGTLSMGPSKSCSHKTCLREQEKEENQDTPLGEPLDEISGIFLT